MRVVIAMMKHETNTFSPIVTDWARFESWGAFTGKDVQTNLASTRMPIAAYMKLASERDAQIVTPLAAEAMPSGRVQEDAYEYMVSLICDSVSSGCDGVFLDLHGAMAAEHTHDGEGTLLERIRSIAPDMPIAVTCDLHCNLTATMVDNCTALIGYKTYPHIDMYEVAEQVGRIVFDAMRGSSTPKMAWGNVPLLSQTLCQGTDDEPMRSLIEHCRAAERRPNVLAATIFGGFALADVPDSGTSAVVVTDAEVDEANTVRDELLAQAWAERARFIYTHRPIEDALVDAQAAQQSPVLMLDHADNCGSGGTQDVMTVIDAVRKAGLSDVIVAAVWDPAAVREMMAVGVGNDVDVSLGGNVDMPAIDEKASPLRLRGRVKALTDGQWVVRGPMYTGVSVDMGASAVLDTGDMMIVVVSKHHEPWDLGVFTSMGIAPEHHRYILLKSRIHYRAGFAPIAGHTVTLDGSGVTTSDNDRLTYKHVRRPIFPLDRINEP